MYNQKISTYLVTLCESEYISKTGTSPGRFFPALHWLRAEMCNINVEAGKDTCKVCFIDSVTEIPTCHPKDMLMSLRSIGQGRRQYGYKNPGEAHTHAPVGILSDQEVVSYEAYRIAPNIRGQKIS